MFAHLDEVAGEVRELAEQFGAAGHRLFLVGGIVRDLWLDRDVSTAIDLDLTTDARPEQVKAIVGPIAAAMWLQGERFGTIGAQIGGRPYEITTHRHEVYADDSRKPAVAFSTAIDEDLSRRDFTINAMAVEVPSVTLIDPFGGASDLAERRLRTPLDPEISFTDDPLRMMRAARFTAGYALDASPELVAAMRALRDRLDIVSVERVRAELDKLLALPDPSAGLELLADTGLLERFLPEAVGTLAERSPSLAALPATPELRLAALLYGMTPDDARAVLGRLRYSNDRQQLIRATLRAADALAAGAVVDAPGFRRWYAAVGAGRAAARAVVRALGSPAVVDESERLEADLAEELVDLGPALTGEDVMAVLDVAEGPTIGRAMAFLQELRYDEGPMAPDVARSRLATWWATQP